MDLYKNCGKEFFNLSRIVYPNLQGKSLSNFKGNSERELNRMPECVFPDCRLYILYNLAMVFSGRDFKDFQEENFSNSKKTFFGISETNFQINGK